MLKQLFPMEGELPEQRAEALAVQRKLASVKLVLALVALAQIALAKAVVQQLLPMAAG